MKREEFLIIKEEIKKFQFTSLTYTQYEDVLDYKILYNNDNLILLYGYDFESKSYEYLWASNNVDDLVNGIDKNYKNVLISFVPRSWIDNLKQIGFNLFVIWNEYIKDDISNAEYSETPDYLAKTEKEYEEASQITLLCRNQSRGFTGQTTDWIKQWMNNSPPAAEENTKNCTILVQRNKGRIIGMICTGTYGHDSEKGAVLWVREVAVHPDFQNQGIARELISQALVYGKKHGATRGFLMADECNENAIHLYESLGFKSNKDEEEIGMIK